MYNFRKSTFIHKALFTSVVITNTNNIKTNVFCQDSSSIWNNNNLKLPKFTYITPKILETSVINELKDFKSNLIILNESIEKISNENPVTVINALESLKLSLLKDWNLINHLMSVNNNNDIRNVHQNIQEKVIMATQELGQSKYIFNGLSNIYNNKKMWNYTIDESQRRIILNKLLDMKHSGVALNTELKEKFNKLQLEAADLGTKFKNNVLDSTKAFKYIITNKDDMDNVPIGSKSLLSSRAKSLGYIESTIENGPWAITLDLPSYQACMQHINNKTIREIVYKGYIMRASEYSEQMDGSGLLNNTPILERLLEIRYEMANMLGYNNYSEMSLSTKMASKIENVNNLIDELRKASINAAQKDLKEVEEFAIQHYNIKNKLELWDIPYYTERLREIKYGFKEEELKVYFPLENVLLGLFSLAQKLFGIKIESIPTTIYSPSCNNNNNNNNNNELIEVWHSDVRFFKVIDIKTNQTIAGFYLDPYARPENKNGGAWMNVCLQKSKLLNQYPIAYLVCNGSPPINNEPALMTFREVETLFHEFGHGLQHMLTTIIYGEASGIANIEWDAVELPSQFMENWCYDIDTLKQFAKHYKTNEPIPNEYITKLKASKNFQSGFQMLRQLYFGALDMKLHSMKPLNKNGWVYDIQKEIASLYTVISPLPEDRFLNGFMHIFGGGYAAGYYSYKWAEILSADAFSAFEEVGLNNTKEIEKLGRKFRDTILASGGGINPSEVFKNFRGREPSTVPLLRHSGLIK